MKLIHQMNWFEQSVVKLELAQNNLNHLKEDLYAKNKNLTAYDQVVITTITTLLRSPIDYALGAVYKKYSNKDKSRWPQYSDEDSFRRNFSKLTKCDDDRIIDVFLRLKIPLNNQDNWFNLLNFLSNNEKHNYIISSNKFTQYSSSIFHESGAGIVSDTTINAGSEHMLPFFQYFSGIPFFPNANKTTTYLFDLNMEYTDEYQYFKNIDAFELLYGFLELVNEFIIYIYELLEPEKYKQFIEQ